MLVSGRVWRVYIYILRVKCTHKKDDFSWELHRLHLAECLVKQPSVPTSSAVHHNELTAVQCAPVPGRFTINKKHGGPIWIVGKPSTRGCSSLILPRFFFQHQKFLVCMMLFRCILENPIGNSWQPMGKSTCQYTRRNDRITNIQNEKTPTTVLKHTQQNKQPGPFFSSWLTNQSLRKVSVWFM